MVNHFLNSSIDKNIIPPREIKQLFYLPSYLKEQIYNFRGIITKIIKRQDTRKLIICGPCSVHDPVAIIDYASKLSLLFKQIKENIFLVLRVYFEKPRTSIGWKGFINDPDLDNSCKIEEGLKRSRKLLIKLAKFGIPLATEILDLNIPHYLGDLFSWYAIGARNSESQLHRELVSSLKTPVGYKNSTDGSVQNAINSIISSAQPHTFLGINSLGRLSICKSKGNSATHVILRGGKTGPNYSANDITNILKNMVKMHINSTILIDCSHDNAHKNFEEQITVFNEVLKQMDNNAIIGMMLESNLYEGNQSILNSSYQYGVSITDACISWETTSNLINKLYSLIKKINN